jgi:hypothetical protein
MATTQTITTNKNKGRKVTVNKRRKRSEHGSKLSTSKEINTTKRQNT